MRRLIRQATWLFCCAALSPLAQAGNDFSGHISFTSRPPLVGLVYVPGAQGRDLPPVVDQVGKEFTRKMVVVSQNSAVEFKNSDDVSHNIFANDARHNAHFDVGLMAPGGQEMITVDWMDDAIVRVGCKIHPRMRTYLATVRTDYHRVIEFDQRENSLEFTLSDVPQHAKKIILRIPKYDVVEIELDAGSRWSAPIIKRGSERGVFTLIREGR